MKKALKEVVSAIENGQKVEDSRGVVYKQEFGEKFLDYLKKSLENNDLEELVSVLDGLVSDVENLLSENDIEWQQAGYHETAKELLKRLRSN